MARRLLPYKVYARYSAHAWKAEVEKRGGTATATYVGTNGWQMVAGFRDEVMALHWMKRVWTDDKHDFKVMRLNKNVQTLLGKDWRAPNASEN